MADIKVTHKRDRELSPDRPDLQQLKKKVPLRLGGEAKHREPRVAYLEIGVTLHLLAEHGGGQQRLCRVDLNPEAGNVEYDTFL